MLGIGRLENSVLGGTTDYAHHCTVVCTIVFLPNSALGIMHSVCFFQDSGATSCAGSHAIAKIHRWRWPAKASMAAATLCYKQVASRLATKLYLGMRSPFATHHLLSTVAKFLLGTTLGTRSGHASGCPNGPNERDTLRTRCGHAGDTLGTR